MAKTQAKLLTVYLLFIASILACNGAFGQIQAVHFNADWNNANDVNWFSELGDCEKKSLLIEADNNQSRYNIAVVPTIVIFDDGEEVKRYQADLSFKMMATKKEIQGYIDELIISKF
jgi:thiol-disulfide isomerase/thioredoxin